MWTSPPNVVAQKILPSGAKVNAPGKSRPVTTGTAPIPPGLGGVESGPAAELPPAGPASTNASRAIAANADRTMASPWRTVTRSYIDPRARARRGLGGEFGHVRRGTRRAEHAEHLQLLHALLLQAVRGSRREEDAAPRPDRVGTPVQVGDARPRQHVDC